MRKNLRVALSCAVACALETALAGAATIPVANGLVAKATDGGCALAEALENANANASVHVDCPPGDDLPSGEDIVVLPPGSAFSLTIVDHVVETPSGVLGGGTVCLRSRA